MYGTNKKITKNKKSFVIKGSNTTSKIIKNSRKILTISRWEDLLNRKRRKYMVSGVTLKKVKINWFKVKVYANSLFVLIRKK